MIRRLARSLSFRLLVIFLLLGGLFVYGTAVAIRWFYNSDDIRGLISGHLSLHVQYVREDIGSPPRIDRAIAITERVPVDIRILGPDIDWASDPAFPRLSELSFGPSPAFSDEPDAWVDELLGVEFASQGDHNFLRMASGDSGEYDIVVVTPRISDVRDGPDLSYIIVGLGLSFLLLGYAAVSWLFKPIRAIQTGAEHIGRGNFDHRISTIRHDQLGDLAADINKLAADVQNMLDAKRALLLGISHELRTPLSRLRLLVEFIDDEGQHLGGQIIAGVSTMADALAAATSDIPRVKPAPGREHADLGMFAHNTAAAVREGAQNAVAGAIDRAIQTLQSNAYQPAIVLTGGDASRILNALCETPLHRPHLVLQGLAHMLDTAR